MWNVRQAPGTLGEKLWAGCFLVGDGEPLKALGQVCSSQSCFRDANRQRAESWVGQERGWGAEPREAPLPWGDVRLVYGVVGARSGVALGWYLGSPLEMSFS